MRDEGGGKGVSSLAPSPQARETWSKVLSVTERGLKAQLCLLGMKAVYNNSGLGFAHGLGFPYVAVAETLS